MMCSESMGFTRPGTERVNVQHNRPDFFPLDWLQVMTVSSILCSPDFKDRQMSLIFNVINVGGVVGFL